MEYKFFILVFVLMALNGADVSAQLKVPNGDFEQRSSKSNAGAASWEAEGSPSFCGIDSKEHYSGNHSMKLTGGAPNVQYFFKNQFACASRELRKFRLKCYFKSKELNGKVQAGVRVITGAGLTTNLSKFILSCEPNAEWQAGEGVFYADETTDSIRVFGSVIGRGTVWFDDFSIEETPMGKDKPAPLVEKYIEQYFDFVKEYSIVRDKKYIAQIQANTLAFCAGMTTIEQCHPVLKEYATFKLGDKHSFFTTPADWKELNSGGQMEEKGWLNFPTGKILDGNIGYIEVPMFVSMEEKNMDKYANTLQDIIADFDKKGVKGWILDISQNGGGNCMPMIAGTGPLLGDGPCSHSFSGNGKHRTLLYYQGFVGWDSAWYFQKENPYVVKDMSRPIAVIYSKKTASSGEVVAISFRGKSHWKSFGQATLGSTTRVDNFEMSDGSYLNLAAGYDVDRNKIEYNGPVKPDVITKDTETAIAAARKWILNWKSRE